MGRRGVPGTNQAPMSSPSLVCRRTASRPGKPLASSATTALDRRVSFQATAPLIRSHITPRRSTASADRRASRMVAWRLDGRPASRPGPAAVGGCPPSPRVGAPSGSPRDRVGLSELRRSRKESGLQSTLPERRAPRLRPGLILPRSESTAPAHEDEGRTRCPDPVSWSKRIVVAPTALPDRHRRPPPWSAHPPSARTSRLRDPRATGPHSNRSDPWTQLRNLISGGTRRASSGVRRRRPSATPVLPDGSLRHAEDRDQRGVRDTLPLEAHEPQAGARVEFETSPCPPP